jgi:threonine synthase
MTVAVSEAAHRGAKSVICASTGNTAASAAAYAARAGMRAIVIIPAGKVAAVSWPARSLTARRSSR